MIFIYNFLLIIFAIILLPVILIAFIIQPKFRAGFFKKIGFYRFDPQGLKTIIFHAVSVGEVNAIKELVKEYRKIHPEKIIIVTTTTKTGQETAKKAFNGIVNQLTFLMIFSLAFYHFLIYIIPKKLL